MRHLNLPQQYHPKPKETKHTILKKTEFNTEKKVNSEENKLSFKETYKILHKKYPDIINIEKPMILAKGTHKILAKEVNMSYIKFKKKFLLRYFKKSHYYSKHKLNAPRINLQGEEESRVTEKEIKGRKEKMKRIVEWKKANFKKIYE